MDDFRSKHCLQVLHVWMLHRRLMSLGKDGIALDEALYDELWEDASNRIRALGVGEMMVTGTVPILTHDWMFIFLPV